MASKRRIRRKECEQKQSYRTEFDAEASVRALARKRVSGGGELAAYRCAFGDHWHLGHRRSDWQRFREGAME